jgi:LAS superfamily LD-carboxypeptidase LdcB
MVKIQSIHTHSQQTSPDNLNRTLKIHSKKEKSTTKTQSLTVNSGSLIIEPIASDNQQVKAIYQVSTYTGYLGQIAMTYEGTWTNSVDNNIYSTPYQASAALAVANIVDCGGGDNVPN